jgi:hypothetical protein
MAAVFGGGAFATWVAIAPKSTFPMVLIYIFAGIGAVALYMCFATTYGLWPTSRPIALPSTAAAEPPVDKPDIGPAIVPDSSDGANGPSLTAAPTASESAVRTGGVQAVPSTSNPRQSGPSPAIAKRPELDGPTAPIERSDRRWHWLRAVLVTVVVLAVGAVGAVALWANYASGPSSLTVSKSFTFEQEPGQLTVTRHWTLKGNRGSVFTETAEVSSSSGTALPFEDPIPAAIASKLGAVHFRPDPSRLITTARAALWEVPAHRTVVFHYWAAVPPAGATQGRLDGWLKNLRKQLASLNLVYLNSLSMLGIKSPSHRIAIDHSMTLKLIGVLFNGKQAPKATLAKAKWHTSNGRVTLVFTGSVARIIGKSAGPVHVTAEIGSIHVSIRITVYSSYGGGPSSGASPSQQHPSPHGSSSPYKIGP